MARHGVAVAGHEEHADLGLQLNDLVHELAAAHPREDEVGEEEMDLLLLPDQLHPRLRVVRDQHAVPLRLQDVPDQGADHLVVFDDEDHLGAARRRPRLERGAPRLGDVAVARK